jgi:hypothetical protein
MTRSRRRRRHAPRRATGPMMLHIFSFTFEIQTQFTPAATILIRSRRGHTDLIGQAYDEANHRGVWPFLKDINTVPSPRPTPGLDRVCQLHTAFPTFLHLLTAAAGYTPTFRLDLTGPEGRVLANAYDAWQTRWGDRRRALVWPCQDKEANHV